MAAKPIRRRPRALTGRLVRKPWGYEVHYIEGAYTLKRLYVAPGQSLSLQYHRRRSEAFWAEAGSGTLDWGRGRTVPIEPTAYHAVPVVLFVGERHVHSVTAGRDGLWLVEVSGPTDPDDIVRIADRYPPAVRRRSARFRGRGHVEQVCR